MENRNLTSCGWLARRLLPTTATTSTHQGHSALRPLNEGLSLYDATINVYGTDEAIKTSMNDLTIRMEGTNTLASTDGHALNIEKGNCTITGGGKMELTGKNFGLYVAPKRLADHR